MGDRIPPIDDSLTVLDSETIYRSDDWWKAVVRYRYEDTSPETAVYLWHKDDGAWSRKNKYIAKTDAGWTTDRRVIDSLIDGVSPESDGPLPVSDYYSVDAGTTISKSDDWWKAVVRIDQKGDYETEEVIVYLWQRQDDEWFRRQKYAIKDRDSWSVERAAISSMLDSDADAADTDRDSTSDGVIEAADPPADIDSDIKSELEQIGDEIDEHLSNVLQE